MIYTVSNITVKENESTINKNIYLYRGDKNIEIQFFILEGVYKFVGTNTIENLGASYGQLIVLRPNKSCLFTDVVPTKDGKVIFTIPQELIDETTEVGTYTFQIVLYDETQESKVTLPPIYDGIVVQESIKNEGI